MKRLVLILLLAASFFSFSSSFEDGEGDLFEVIKYPTLLEMLENPESEILIVNFWATWCGPCVKELPYFERVQEKFRDQGVEVKLISLDDVAKLEEKVIPFAVKKGLKSSLYLLDETDFNAFVDKVDKRWSGAIPATVIVNSKTGKRLFIGEAVSEGELERHLAKIM